MPRTAKREVPGGPVITTLLLPAERQRVDAAGAGFYRALHRESLDDALRDIRDRRAGAMLLSVTCCETAETARLAALVREFPQSQTVALLSSSEATAAQTVLALGRSGVRTLIDVRTPVGWRELRDVLRSEAVGEIERLALARLAVDLAGVSDDCWLFFETVLRDARSVGSVRSLARRLGILPSTLMSRFFRLGLPAPKRYLAYVRLVRAAKLGENPGLSIATIANHLDYSSPQSYGRHVRTIIGVSATEFRRRYDGEGMLERFRAELITPYRARLVQLRPLAPT
ncbi:MAG TPA: helix-turn-helix domain-containing protein [Gemmatimonadaceae bacterium]|nr:helix-turn-helix domain-containing protein [Gemmatimonadaceae bacterium]